MGTQAMLKLVANDEDRAICQRQSARFKVLITAKVLTTTDEQPVKVRDLSSTGARLEGAKLPAPGTDVILKRGSLDVFATVIWRDGCQCGLQFEEPLTEREILEQIHQPQAPARPAPTPGGHRRPGFRNVALSEEELALGREWANGKWN